MDKVTCDIEFKHIKNNLNEKQASHVNEQNTIMSESPSIWVIQAIFYVYLMSQTLIGFVGGNEKLLVMKVFKITAPTLLQTFFTCFLLFPT